VRPDGTSNAAGPKMRTLRLAKRNHIYGEEYPLPHISPTERAFVGRSEVCAQGERAHRFAGTAGGSKKMPQSAAGLGRSAQPVPQKKPVRGKGGGRKPIFTPEEKIRLQGIYRELLGEDSKFKKYSLAEPRMRRLLPKDKKGVSLRTLKRDVFWPVLGKRTK
jgi:hypothetical protein